MFLNAIYTLYSPSIDPDTRLASYKRLGAFSCYEELENGGDNAEGGAIGEFIKHSLDALWAIYLGLMIGGFKLLQRHFSKTAHDSLKGLFSQELEAMQAQMSLLREGLLSMLRYRINRNAQRYLDQGYITITQRDDLEHLYNSYKALRGNGTAEALYMQCRDLPTKIK